MRQWLSHDILSIVPKIAVWSLVQGLAKEEGKHGVRANAVGVGVIDAGMTLRGREDGSFSDDFFNGVARASALRRIEGPLWFINGQWDQLRVNERLFLRVAQHAELIVVPRTTHHVTVMRPRVFNAMLDVAITTLERSDD